MKLTRRPITSLAAVTLFSALTITSFASSSKPYESYSTKISKPFLSSTRATSTITRCSCIPVDNYLFAGVRVQCEEGNNYVNYPNSPDTYYYEHGYNVGTKKITVTYSDIIYAKGWFQARCGKGSQKSYFAEDRR